jgi:hypothetical protein
MSQPKMYKRHPVPPEIIQYAVWLYYLFSLSHGDGEDLLAAQGITVSYAAFACGAISSHQPMLGASEENIRATATLYLLMRCSLRSRERSITDGEL